VKNAVFGLIWAVFEDKKNICTDTLLYMRIWAGQAGSADVCDDDYLAANKTIPIIRLLKPDASVPIAIM